jgi:hypothetical protein
MSTAAKTSNFLIARTWYVPTLGLFTKLHGATTIIFNVKVTVGGTSGLMIDVNCSDGCTRLVPLLHVRCLAAGTLAVRLPILKWLNVPMPCESVTHTLQRPDCIIRLSLSPYTGKRSQQHSDDEGKLKQILEDERGDERVSGTHYSLQWI